MTQTVFSYDTTSRILAVVHVALIVALWLVPLLTYTSLPDRIPVHFNLDGQADRWEEKSLQSLFLIPAIWTVVGTLIFVLLRYRRAFNYPQKDEVNKLPEPYQQPVHVLNRRFILAIFVIIGAMFVYLEYAVIDTARDGAASMNLFGILVPMGLTFALTITYLIRMRGVVERAINAAKRNQGV
ncbi:MAG: hypothetical protein Kow0074_07160 [Candidatus Zixiibacteriota bacterium]